MPDECRVTGLFNSEDSAAHAIDALSKTSWTVMEVCSPIPSDIISMALKVKKSRVGYFTLFGAVVGFFSGLGLAMYSADQWGLIVSGKPVISFVPFFIVAFELTILFSVAANVIGFLLLTGLPRLRLPDHCDPVCTEDKFGVVAQCRVGEKNELVEFFEKRGGYVR